MDFNTNYAIPTLSEWCKAQDFPPLKRRLLTKDEIEAIRTALKSKTVKVVALEFNRAYNTVYLIARNKWVKK